MKYPPGIQLLMQANLCGLRYPIDTRPLGESSIPELGRQEPRNLRGYIMLAATNSHTHQRLQCVGDSRGNYTVAVSVAFMLLHGDQGHVWLWWATLYCHYNHHNY